VHLSRLAGEVVLWTSSEFGFAELPDTHATGSSLMPQKKNPDVLELVRGRTSRGIAELCALLIMLKGLPLAYNRDLQEDKVALFDAVDTTLAALGVNISAEELFATLSDAWAELRGVWDDGRGFGEIRRLWLERAAGLGQKVTVQNGGSTVEGTFDTLDESGCMVIRTPDGGRVPISAGDVYFGSAASAGAV